MIREIRLIRFLSSLALFTSSLIVCLFVVLDFEMNFNQNNPNTNFNDAPFVLEQQLISGLIANREVAERWEKRKKGHEELKNNLEFFARKMKHRVFAPIGNKAMMKADLMHTNEITVSLG